MATPKGGARESDLTNTRVALSARFRAAWEGWFGAGEPMTPVAPKEEVEGRPFDFPFAVNINSRPRSEASETAVSFALMRQLAEPGDGGLDLLRLAIETRKDQMAALGWTITGTDDDGGPRAREIEDVLQRPDGQHSFSQWLRMILEDHMVIDAVTVFPRGTPARPVLDLIDAATIKVVLDANGRQPLPPFPAYQQNLHGMPAVNYTRDELLSFTYNVRTNRLYGLSRVEQVINVVNLALLRQLYILQYYSEGNVPEALIGVPKEWTPEQIKAFQVYWDAYLTGDMAARRHAKFVPGGMSVLDTKEDALKNEFDEWLARIIAYCFSLPPTPLVKMMNRSVSETAKEAGQEEGLEPMKLHVEQMMNTLLRAVFNAPELRWAWEDEEITDPMTKANVIQVYVGKPVMTQDEGREMLGLPAMTPEQQDLLNPPPPPMLQLGPGGGNPDDPEAAPADAADPATKVEKAGKKNPRGRSLQPPRDAFRVAYVENRVRAAAQAALGEIRGAVVAAVALDKVAKLDAKDAARLVDAIDPAHWKTLSASVRSALQGMAVAQADDAVRSALSVAGKTTTDAGLDAMLSVANEDAIAWAKQRAGELITQVSAATKDGVKDIVARALEEGLSNDQLAARLRDAYEFSDDRALLIARTETSFAENAGTVTGWAASGVVQGKQWLASADACDECQELDGDIVGLGESFRDGSDAPPQHPRCRCSLLAALVD